MATIYAELLAAARYLKKHPKREKYYRLFDEDEAARTLDVEIGIDSKGRRVFPHDGVPSGARVERPKVMAEEYPLGWMRIKAEHTIETVALMDGECYGADSHHGMRAAI